MIKSPIRMLQLFAAAMVCLCAAGCKSAGGGTNSISDYRVNSMYQLKVPAFIMANNGLVMTVEEGRARGVTEVEALLEPGIFFTVRQIKSVKDDNQPRTEIYAEVSSGEKRGRIVNLRTLSLADRGPKGFTRLNPEVLQPFWGR